VYQDGGSYAEPYELVVRVDAYKFAVRIGGYGLHRLRKNTFRREAGVSTPA
jgi:hypothetical protein